MIILYIFKITFQNFDFIKNVYFLQNPGEGFGNWHATEIDFKMT